MSPPPTPRVQRSRYDEASLPSRSATPPRRSDSGYPSRIDDAVTPRANYGAGAPSPPPSSRGRVDDNRSVVSTIRRGPAASEAGTLTDNLQKLKLTSFYVRPGFGKDGKAIDVLSNFFAVRPIDGRGKIIQ